MAEAAARSRYWSRNFAGWEQFRARQPNASHLQLTSLQRRDWIDFIITQNVDRLHHKAGAEDVVELHGTIYECVTLSGGDACLA